MESTISTVFDTTQIPKSHEISVILTDDAGIQKLNRKFRGIDAPTDVLSFESGDLNPETGLVYAGDIIISGDILIKQALESGHSNTEELQLLLTHGTLHLLGFDHSEDQEKEKMWKVQREILTQLGCTNIKLD